MFFLLFSGSYVIGTSLKTWAAAQQYCIDLGGRLMEVRTQEDFDRAIRVEEETSLFWLGGSDVLEEGVWVWDSNNQQINLDVFWYHATEPNGDTEQNCLIFALSAQYVGLASDDCELRRRFICEFFN